MLPWMTALRGMGQAFPDACATPPAGAPVPYPNLGMCGDGAGSKNVLAEGAAILRKGDKIRRTTGDEAGNMPGGVLSGTFAGEAVAGATQQNVKVEGQPVTLLGDPYEGNGRGPMNAKVGLFAVPGQIKLWTETGGGGGTGTGKDPVKDAEEVLRCSPELQAQIDEFRGKGWEIKYWGGGTQIDKISAEPSGTDVARMQILVDFRHRDNTVALANEIAHEIGHSRDGFPKYVRAATESEFVDANTAMNCRSEGKAVANQLDHRQKIRQSKDPDCAKIDLTSGPLHGIIPVSCYAEHFRFRQGKIDRETLESRLGEQYSKANLRGAVETHESAYRRGAKELWDLLVKEGKA